MIAAIKTISTIFKSRSSLPHPGETTAPQGYSVSRGSSYTAQSALRPLPRKPYSRRPVATRQGAGIDGVGASFFASTQTIGVPTSWARRAVLGHAEPSSYHRPWLGRPASHATSITRDLFRPALTEAVWFRNSAPEPHATASIFPFHLHSESADRNDARIILARLKLDVEPVPFHYKAERLCSFPKVDVQQATEPLPVADQRIRSALRHPYTTAWRTRGMGKEARQVLAFSIDTVWFEIDLPELLSMLSEPVLCQ